MISLTTSETLVCSNNAQEGHSFEKVSPGSTRRDLAASVLFRVPVLRELALAAGGVDASRPVVERMLRKGLSIGVVGEGIRTETTTTNTNTITTTKRQYHQYNQHHQYYHHHRIPPISS